MTYGKRRGFGRGLTAEPTHRLLGNLIPGVVRAIADRAGMNGREILRAWPEIVGSGIARSTRADRFESGVLHVIVTDASTYGFLVSYEKGRLMSLLRNRFPETKILNMVFHVG
ncbi:MAG: DUF721 domain-containing protein [Simkaniaceae bacterium]|nr:DUF721 domain-containing protein [Simkaniaceae bacterium]